MTETEFAMRLFDQFAYCDSMTEKEKKQIIEGAFVLGESRAKEIKQEYALDNGKDHAGTENREPDPEGLLKRLGLRIVCQKDAGREVPDYVRFAEYHSKSGMIYLNGAVLEKLDRKIEPGLAKKIILSHELYHYFEVQRWGKTSCLFAAKVRLFGFICVKRNMIPASEIAASRFAKVFLGTEIAPWMLEELYFQ